VETSVGAIGGVGRGDATLRDRIDGVYDRVEYTYNRQGERTTKKDQNETVHAFDYDLFGHLIEDRVTAVGTGVATHVRRSPPATRSGTKLRQSPATTIRRSAVARSSTRFGTSTIRLTS
jgi:YD repeat-containing protein